jgi:hypothetical protein
MTPIAFALALFLQAQPAVDPTVDPAAAPAPDAAAQPAEPAAEDRWPAGAPHDDYLFVAWCYGSLRAYLDLHDRVMPEVTRIEATFRPPGRKLSDDMKVYADMQKEGRSQLKTFQGAMTAAEKASLKPINTLGADAVTKGRSIWKSAADVPPARLAQEWMSWALPARCDTTAKTLHDRAVLMGASFKVNDEQEPEAAPPPPEAPAPGSDAAKALLEGSPPPADPAPATPDPPAPSPNHLGH